MASAIPTDKVAVSRGALGGAGIVSLSCVAAAAAGSPILVAGLLCALQLAVWIGYRQFLDTEVWDKSGNSARFKGRLLGQATVGAVALVPLGSALVGNGRALQTAVVGLGLSATILVALEATRRRFSRGREGPATPPPDLAYRLYAVAVPATLVVAAWVLAIDVIYDGTLEWAALAYVLGSALTLGVGLAYLPFLATWVVTELQVDLVIKAAVALLWCLLFSPQVTSQTTLSGWAPLVVAVLVTAPFVAVVEPARRRAVRRRWASVAPADRLAG